jgi:hypothetical protein
MPRDGSGVYTTLAGTHGIPDTTIASTPYNLNVDDVATDLNAPRPIIAGGTGSSTAAGARDNLDAERSNQIVTNYSSQVWEFGSFSSAAGATDAPTANAFAGIVYGTDANNLVVEARDQSTGILYVRRKVGGAWQGTSPFWTSNLEITANINGQFGLTVTNTSGGTGAAAAMLLSNGTNTAYYGLKGTGAASYLGWNAGEAAVYNTGNVVLMADAAGGAFKFISAGAEIMTLNPAGVFSRTGGFDIQGTNTNDAAPAGFVGECIVGERTQALAVAVPNLTPTTLTSIPLTAGDWDVDAVAHFIGEPAMQLTVIAASISLVNNALDTSPGRLVATNMSAAPHFTAAWGVEVIPIPPYRISLPGPATIYLVGRTDFTSGSTQGFGRIQARRPR